MKNKIIIIGGGFAGIAAAKTLANSKFEVLILDRNNHHIFQPLLYQVASAALSPGDIAVPIREIISHAKNIKVYMEEVSDINKEGKLVTCISGNSYEYDYLIMAPGSTPFYFGNEKWPKLARGLKSLDDAVKIRNNILKTFERHEVAQDTSLNFVIIGGGPTGVELAGAFAEIANDILKDDFRNFDSSKANIILVEGGEKILGTYGGNLPDKAQSYLKKLGVTIYLGKKVEEIFDDRVIVDGETIFSNNIIWAAGNKASPLCNCLNVEQDRMGRVFVNRDLSLEHSPDVFILGDAANFKDSITGTSLPSLAPVASQQGRFIAKNLISNERPGFKYLDKGSMATIGKYRAILELKGIRIGGLVAWLAWCFVHVLFLINFRNKVFVFFQWAYSFIFNKRGVRIIK
jgi:NADH dehydrogenase